MNPKDIARLITEDPDVINGRPRGISYFNIWWKARMEYWSKLTQPEDRKMYQFLSTLEELVPFGWYGNPDHRPFDKWQEVHSWLNECRNQGLISGADESSAIYWTANN